MEWVTLFIIILILGALAGGDSFGESVRRGCGCLIWIMIALFILAAIASKDARQGDTPPSFDAPRPRDASDPIEKPRRGNDEGGLEVRAADSLPGLAHRIGGLRHSPNPQQLPGAEAV